MKSKVIAALLITLFLVTITATVLPVSAAPTTWTLVCPMAFFEWSTGDPWSSPFGDWSRSAPPPDFRFAAVFNATKNVLRYPDPDLPIAFVHDKKTGLWIQHGGPYEFYLWGLNIVNYDRGYLSFAGTPSNATFQHGVEYSWGYVYGVDEATVKATCPYAVWDETMDAWLVYFLIILFDATPTTYTVPFPSPFLEPVPANNYNPLGL